MDVLTGTGFVYIPFCGSGQVISATYHHNLAQTYSMLFKICIDFATGLLLLLQYIIATALSNLLSRICVAIIKSNQCSVFCFEISQGIKDCTEVQVQQQFF